jgi:hypothetical protein
MKLQLVLCQFSKHRKKVNTIQFKIRYKRYSAMTNV